MSIILATLIEKWKMDESTKIVWLICGLCLGFSYDFVILMFLIGRIK
jgi:hypothetical protein